MSEKAKIPLIEFTRSQGDQMRKASGAMVVRFAHTSDVINEASLTSYTGKWKKSRDSQSWAAWMEKKATRAPAKK